MNPSQLRNIAIIAHVDHGKTTLVDAMLKQSSTAAAHQQVAERAMDSMDLEKERGITILSKTTSVDWGEHRVQIVDTPGHADFGGEVERVMSMVDGCLLLVDACEGPMPQTRFVLTKALARGLRPIVVVNKVDRHCARPDWVIDQVFDLFVALGATNEQCDFPVVYGAARNGWMGDSPDAGGGDLQPLFDLIVKHVPSPGGDPEGPFRMQVVTLGSDPHLGLLAIGRIDRGSVKTGTQVKVCGLAREANGRIVQVMTSQGLVRTAVESASAGEIVQLSGVLVEVGETLCSPDAVEPHPPIAVDAPTLTMEFMVNDSPLAGTEGKFVTSRQIRDRLMKEAQVNVALKVEDTDRPEVFKVHGRGELHLSVLIETMRREGFELAVSRPRVIIRHNDQTGAREEPYEELTVDVPDTKSGPVMELLGPRRAEMKEMAPLTEGQVRMVFDVPARGLLGLSTDMLTATQGDAQMSHIFSHYGPYLGALPTRAHGVQISGFEGETVAFALWNLEDRGRHFVGPGEKVYEGMLIGLHSRENDLVVNPLKGKKLTNMRASGTDEAVRLTPKIDLNLERAIELIGDDELVEVTPQSIRLRKRFLKEHERKRAHKAAE